MNPFLALILAALPLAAGEALHVAAVERKGWPPFEDDRRVYRIEGGDVSRLRVGENLTLQRPGTSAEPGRLKVARVAPEFAEAYLEQRGGTYPLRGDLAEPPASLDLPRIPEIKAGQDLRPATPSLEPPPEQPAAHDLAPTAPLHPRLLEPVYFLEGDAALSPKGREKLKRMVAEWGADGAWFLGLPEDRTLPSKVREERIRALRGALRSLGVGRLELRAVELRLGDRGDVVYAAKD
jgi:hypothetical protein